MKFFGIVSALVLLSTVAQANLLTGILNGVIEKQRTNKEFSKIVEDAMAMKHTTADIAQDYATLLWDQCSKLSILARSAEGGNGKNVSYVESGLDTKLPCGATLYSTKDGIVTIILEENCAVNAEQISVKSTNVIRALSYIGGRKVYCEQNICQIDYVRK